MNARCSRCGGVFAIEAPGEASASATPPPASGAIDSAGHTAPLRRREGAAEEDPARGGMTEGQADLPELGEPPREPPVAPAIADEPLATEKALREPAAPSTPPAPPGPDPERRPEDPQRERPGAGVPPPPPLFGRPDPHGKARRLARALISDIAVYNPERRDRSIAGGTLRQEFRDEIRKSWDEYVAQVGETIARGTPYFREALNEILAGGRPVF